MLRDRCAEQLGIRNQLTSGTTHRTLWTLGFVLSLVLIGIPILLTQAVMLIRDHNLIAEAAAAHRRSKDG